MAILAGSTSTDELRRTEVIGACIVSAAGSLPLHLTSFMVALVAAEGRLPVAQAGWISSCFMAGLFASTVGLPLLGVRRVTAVWPLVGVLLLGMALWVGSAYGPGMLLGGWVLIGAVCGLLHFLGSTSAASYHDRHFVFGLRLALVLFAASAVIGGAGLIGGLQILRLRCGSARWGICAGVLHRPAVVSASLVAGAADGNNGHHAP